MKTDNTRNERQRRWYWNHLEEALAKRKDRYHKAKEAGICVQCFRGRATDGTVRCDECRAKKRLKRGVK